MCEICEKEKIFLKKEVISQGSWGWGNLKIGLNEVIENTLGLFIDKRDNISYLRLVDIEDCQCLEAGKKIEVNFCPFCGQKLN